MKIWKSRKNSSIQKFAILKNGLYNLYKESNPEAVLDYQRVYNNSHRDRGRSFDELSKEEIYEMLYHDSITGYYNWTHMWHELDPKKLRITPMNSFILTSRILEPSTMSMVTV